MLHQLHILADAPELPEKMGLWEIIRFVWMVIITYFMYRLSKADRDFSEVEKRLHVLAEKLVDTRFEGMSHSIKTHVNGFKLTLDLMANELNTAREKYVSLKDGDHSLEVKLLESLADIRDEMKNDNKEFRGEIREMRDVMATKDDVDRMCGGQRRG